MESEFDPRLVWREFLSRIGLSSTHAADLAEKRGFSEFAIQTLGFRSSEAGNAAAIKEVVAMFPGKESELERIDLIRKTPDGWRPSPQLCGFGKTKKRDPQSGKEIWEVGVNPVLIPYYDESGAVYFVRAHKGNPRRPSDVDEYDEDFHSQQIYCPMLLRTAAANLPDGAAALNRTCIITEGEFKAAALWQCGIPAIALPGIHTARNYPAKLQLVSLLQRFGFDHIIVAFDNESKDDPSLPGYKSDPEDRYDTVVYAIYTSEELRREGFQTDVLWIPNEWREAGKADWDGALARFVREAKGEVQKGTARAAKEFLRVIRKNREEDAGYLSLFPGERERVVQNKLNRIYYKRKAPYGDEKLMKLAKRLQFVNPGLSKALRACSGCYFERVPMFPSTKEGKEAREQAQAELQQAREKKDWIKVKEIEQLLEGWPNPISNFIIHFDYKLVNASGKIEYLVRLTTTNREKTEQHIRITSSSLARLANWREFLIGQTAAANFGGGEKDLQAIVMDGQSDSAHKEIREVEQYGYMQDARIWKFADRAYDDDGNLVLPDKNKVFWYNGTGYQTDFQRRLGEGFAMGAPVLGELDVEKAAKVFCLMSKHMFDVIGDFGGWLALGAVLAYPAHPEILATYKGAPGLWMTGKRGSGKSTILEWLMRIFGFPIGYIAINQSTTGNGVSRELSKYPCLPCCYDEFDDTTTQDAVKEIFKNSFNRSATLKAAFDNSNRTRLVVPGTTPVVGGENGSRNSATRQRFTQVIVSEIRAKGTASTRLNEMTALLPDIPNLGHFLIKNRKRYSSLVMSFLKAYVESGLVQDSIFSQRMRFVSGTPAAAWMAAAELLKSSVSDKTSILALEKQAADMEFEKFTVQYGVESHQDTQETTYIATFWQDFLSAIRTNSELKKFVALRYVQYTTEKRVDAVLEHRHPGYMPAMFIVHDTAFHIYEQEVRKLGRAPKLGRPDVLREAKRENYWLRPKLDQTHKIFIAGHRYSGCWCVDLNELPYGEEFHFALQTTDDQKALENSKSIENLTGLN